MGEDFLQQRHLSTKMEVHLFSESRRQRFSETRSTNIYREYPGESIGGKSCFSVTEHESTTNFSNARNWDIFKLYQPCEIEVHNHLCNFRGEIRPAARPISVSFISLSQFASWCKTDEYRSEARASNLPSLSPHGVSECSAG